jgi:hypothetical protein
MRDKAVAAFAAMVLITLGLRMFEQSQGHLISSGTWVDLGNVSVGQTTEKQFSIINSSSKAIEILRWTPTCHCMQMRFAQEIVPPHDKADAFVRTTALLPLGSRAAVIAVQWRYVGEQFIRTDNLVARARYVSIVSLSEERLDFGTVQSTEHSSKWLSLRNGNSGIRWNDLEIASDSKNLSVHLLRGTAGFQILSQLNPLTLSTGIWKSKIRIFPVDNGTRTGDEVDVPIVAKIEGPFWVSPSVIQFSPESVQPLFFSLKIHSRAGPMSGLKFVGELVQNPRIMISNGGREAVMTGVLPAPASKGAYVGKIPIQVNNDPAEILQVSFFGFPG